MNEAEYAQEPVRVRVIARVRICKMSEIMEGRKTEKDVS